MTAVGPSILVPYPVHPKQWAKNERCVPAVAGHYVMDAYNHVLAHSRKLVAAHSIDYGALPTAQANPARIWRGFMHTGEEGDDLRLRFHTLVAPAGNAAAVDPLCYWEVTESGAGTTNGAEHHYGPYKASWGLDDLHECVTDVSVDPDTKYELALVLNDYCQPVSACIHETHHALFDAAGSYVSSAWEAVVGEPILNTHHNDMRMNGHVLWKHNAQPLWSWACDADPDLYAAGAANKPCPVEDANTLCNAFRKTDVAWGAADPGVKVQAQHWQSAHETADVDCVFAAYCKDNGGPAGTGQVKLIDTAGTLATLTGYSAVGEWKTTTCVVPGNVDTRELQVYFQSDATPDDFELWAFSLYPYVT